MGKLLFWVVAIAVIWSVLTLIRISQRKQERAQADAEARRRAGAPGGGAGGRGTGGRAPERIVACAHCGVYLPYSDAVRGRGSDSGDYCCVEHRDAARR